MAQAVPRFRLLYHKCMSMRMNYNQAGVSAPCFGERSVKGKAMDSKDLKAKSLLLASPRYCPAMLMLSTDIRKILQEVVVVLVGSDKVP